MEPWLLSRIKRSKTRQVSNGSILGGFNAGDYPQHHFLFSPVVPQMSSLPLSVVFAGYDIWNKECFRYRKKSDTFSLELVVEGSFEFEQDTRHYTVLPGELFFVHLRKDSAMGHSGNKPARKLTISLTGPLLESILALLKLECLDVMTLPHLDEYCEIFQSIEVELQAPTSGFERRISQLAYNLLLKLSEDSPEEKQTRRFFDIIHYISLNLHRKLEIADLTQNFSISASTLHRLFKDSSGDTPVNYIIKQKMMVAKQMLLNSDFPIKCIAERVGYENALYFSSEFRKTYGMSPSQYRRKSEEIE